jgi:hypothetical protein
LNRPVDVDGVVDWDNYSGFKYSFGYIVDCKAADRLDIAVSIVESTVGDIVVDIG